MLNEVKICCSSDCVDTPASWSAAVVPMQKSIARKLVFGVSDRVMLLPTCSAIDTSYNVEGSLDILQVRLRVCTSWLVCSCCSHAKVLFFRIAANMGLIARKPVFGVSEQVMLLQTYLAIDTSYNA